MKIWTSRNKRDDKIIAYVDNTIYKGNPKESVFENELHGLNQGRPSRNLFSVPQSLLKEINLTENEKSIRILFGNDSSEELKIQDDDKRKEIFDYLKEHIPNSRNSVETQSRIKAGKKTTFCHCNSFSAIRVDILYSTRN
ncbi:hypothetical protein [Flavobacterium silvaticum]|uniref:Uncharacterized protein n=1 Tax=Flavobacterium silvaticum TaxID=1852020 RepID=A0A972FSV5_9FLAO|nr:hypothetical protein [Flavobacterium silvaticum]NMH27848.1 hypothetical protein [Flavobacterium silvaticum]